MNSKTNKIIDVYPLSYVQAGIYTYCQRFSESAIYHDLFELEVETAWRADAFTQSLQRQIEQHPLLRTSFDFSSFSKPMQLVYQSGKIRLSEITEPYCDLDKLKKELLAHKFDLSAPTQFRCTIIPKHNSFTLLIDAHHILFDGWSMANIIGGLLGDYRKLLNEEALAPVIKYKSSFKHFVKAELDSVSNAEAQQFWQEQLADIEYLSFNGAKAANQERSFDEMNIVKSVKTYDFQQVAKLQEIAQAAGVHIQHILLAVHMRVLSYVFNTTNVTSALTSNGRLESSEGDKVVGLFVNSLPININLQSESWYTLFQRVKQRHGELQKHRRYPFYELVKKHGSPLTDICFTFTHFHNYQEIQSIDAINVSGANVEEINDFPFDCAVNLMPSRQLSVTLQVDKSQFGEAIAERVVQCYGHCLSDILESPENEYLSTHCFSNSMVSEQLAIAEKAQREWRCNEDMVALIEAVATNKANEVAVSHNGQQLTYQELNSQANQLANYLVSKGVKPQDYVIVCTPRTLNMPIVFLALLKIKAIYLPVNDTTPTARLQQIIQNTACKLVLSVSALETLLPSEGIGKCLLDVQATTDEIKAFSRGFNSQSEQLHIDNPYLYAVFTSGSTGKPKGVATRNSGIVSSYLAWNEVYGLDKKNHVVLQMASIGFDVSIGDLTRALCSGGRLVICDQEIASDAIQLHQLIESEKVTIGEFVPAILKPLVDYLESSKKQLGQVEWLIVGSDTWLLEDHMRTQAMLPDDVTLVNSYGLSECAVDSTYFVADRQQSYAKGVSIIGKPYPNVEVYILDGQLQLVLPGTSGELFIGGTTVSDGFLFNEQINAERFIKVNIAGEEKRLYKTGDVVRYRDDGLIEFSGRSDEQVKLNGYRIELGEVQHYLQQLPEVQDVSVQVKDDTSGKARLVAYVVLSGQVADEKSTEQVLRNQLQQNLPTYMVPSHWEYLDILPLTANGKVNKKALPVPQTVDSVKGDIVEPSTDTEAALYKIWQSLLPSEHFGITDNFFAQGGDSIIAIQVVAKLKRAGWLVTVQDIFKAPTIEELTALSKPVSSKTKAVQIVKGEQALLPVQHAFFEDLVDISHDNQSVMLRVASPFNKDTLSQMVAALYQVHDALRLRFESSPPKGIYVHFNSDMIEQSVVETHLSEWCEIAITQVANEMQRSLSITHGPVFKAVLLYGNNAEQRRLLLVCHHLIVDGVSWRIILEDLESFYADIKTGNKISLPAKSHSFQSWGQYLLDYGKSDSLAKELPFWQEVLSQPVESLLGNNPNGIGRGEVTEYLNAQITESLLGDSHYAYSTQLNELLLAGVLRGVHAFNGNQSLRVDMEGHGREVLNSGLDLSRTMGWFTSVFPVSVSMPSSSSDIGALVCAVKEQYRTMPNKGLGFGILRYLTKQLESVNSELQINYLGQFDQNVTAAEAEKAGVFSLAPESVGDMVSKERKTHPLNLLAMVSGGELSLSLDYDARRLDNNSAERLMSLIVDGISQVVRHCCAQLSVLYTPSDFPLARVTQSELNQWQSSHTNIDNLYPATGMQKGLIFHSLLEPGAYISQIGVLLQGLDVAAFKQAWSTVVANNNIYRTAFVGLDSGNIHQLVLPETALEWHENCLAHLDEVTQQSHIETYQQLAKSAEFDISHAPLMRLALFDLGNGRYHFEWTNHHVLIDGWSTGITFSQVLQAYVPRGGEARLNITGSDYQEYIKWLEQQDVASAMTYWRACLAGLSVRTPLPLATNSSEAGGLIRQKQHYSVEQTNQLQQLAQRAGTTVNTVLQAAWGYTMSLYSGESSVVFGSTVSGRPGELAGVEQMLGLFINTVPVVQLIDAEESVEEWLKRLHQEGIARDQHSYLPLHQIQECAPEALSRQLFDSLMVFENYPIDKAIDQYAASAGVTIESIDSRDDTSFALTLTMELEEQLSVLFEFDDSRFSTDAAETVCEFFQALLLSMSELPTNSLKELSWQVAKPIAAREFETPPILFTDILDRIAGELPSQLALVCGDVGLSYRELDQASNQIANGLLNAGVKTGDRVGLYHERSASLIIALLGIFKAGATFVPLSPSQPSERNAVIIKESRLDCIIYGNDRPDVSCSKLHSVSALQRSSTVATARNLNPEQTAYVIYTSGSTGIPKGVAVSYGAISQHLQAITERFKVTSQDNTFQFGAFTFDIFIEQVLYTLAQGATLHLRGDELPSVQSLTGYLAKEKISLIDLTPQYLDALLEHWLHIGGVPEVQLTRMVVGGEALPITTVEKWLQLELNQRCELLNAYGPTEGVVTATVATVGAYEDLTSIGEMLPGRNGVVLSGVGECIPQGGIGELCLYGLCLAQGYINNGDETKRRFTAMPHGKSQMYRTGDLVRQKRDGSFSYVGRLDEQVKIRGYRIELEEISAVIGALDEVSQVLVEQKSNEHGVYLIAYVLPGLSSISNVEIEQSIKDRLRDILPEYMHPDFIVVMEEFPLTVVGKVDKRALPTPQRNIQTGACPASDTEKTLAQIWGELLDLDITYIYQESDFFALGGNSLLTIRLVSAIETKFGCSCPVKIIFQFPELTSLANQLELMAIANIQQSLVVSDNKEIEELEF